MRRCHVVKSLVLCLVLGTVVSTVRGDDDAANQIRGVLRDYVEAFNQHDAAAVAAYWSENAVYVDRETGDRLEGREALQADFAGLFEANADARLVGEMGDISFVTDDVAIANGTATVYAPDGSVSLTDFSATFVRAEGTWLIHTVHESDVAIPPTAYDALQPLAWMVGTWIDESDDVSVETNVRWAPGGNFLLRSFLVSTSDGPVKEGTQVIGWDPRSLEIRSWSFDSDGSFGDGVWSLSGDRWLVRSTQTLTDGAAASGTYVITPVDENSMTVQLIGHEVEGEPRPTQAAVTIVRVASEQAAADAEGNNGGNE